MTALHAGQHPVPLDLLHAQETDGWLLDHLTDVHRLPVTLDTTSDEAQQMHRQAHGGDR